MSPIAAALTAALLHSLWLGAIVALTLTFLVGRLKEHTPNLRYAVLLVGLGVLSVTPAVTAWVFYQPSVVGGNGGVTDSITASWADPVSAGLSASTGLPMLQWVLPIWLLGVGLFSLRLIWAFTRIVRLRRRGIDASSAILDRARVLAGRMGLERRFRVVETSDLGPDANGPGVVGWLRPMVFLPSSTLLGLSPDQLEAILAHELAHIRRHDYLVNLAQMVVETLMFFNPAVWWISARLREERELCCDDLAIQTCGDAVVYARALTRLERTRLEPGPAVAAGGRTLGSRIRRVLGQPSSSAGSSLAPGLIVLAVALTAGFLTTFGLEASVQDPVPVERSAARPAAPTPAPVPVERNAPAQVERNAPAPAAAPVPAPALVPVEGNAPEPAPTPVAQAPDAWAVYVTRDQGRMSIVTAGTDVPTADDLGSGDVLWFRRGGEAWVVRDLNIVNEVAMIAANNRGLRPPANLESRAAEQAAIEARAREAEASTAMMRQQMEALRAELEGRASQDGLETEQSRRAEIELQELEVEMRQRMMELDAVRSELERIQARQASLQKLGEAGGDQIERIFEDAIASGLAQPAP